MNWNLVGSIYGRSSKDCSFCPDPSTNIAAIGNSCFWLADFYTPVVLWYTNVRLSVRPFHMSRSNLRTPWPIHFKFHRVIGIDDVTVCILHGEISNFHSRVMGLYSSNCRRFFICRAVNSEPLHQFTSSFVLLLELIVFTDFSKNVVFNCINIV